VTIELELDGRRRQVTLRRENDDWRAEIDGREVAVSVVEAAGPAPGRRPVRRSSSEGGSPGGSRRWSMLVGPVAPAGASGDSRSVASGFMTAGASAKAVSRTSYEIAFEPSAGGELLVHVNGVVVVPITVVERQRRRHSGGADRDADGQPQTIVAPMPGRIVKVLVQPGEAVQARQGLIVIEAMKMENELRAPRGGTVTEVRVGEGSSVEANSVLVVLE
jgi:biotin carboxyl carrier protein